MHQPEPAQQPFLTGRAFVDYIRANYLPNLAYSRFRKDRAARKAPAPIAHYGNRELFLPAQAASYVESLITKTEAEDEAA